MTFFGDVTPFALTELSKAHYIPEVKTIKMRCNVTFGYVTPLVPMFASQDIIGTGICVMGLHWCQH